MRHVKQLIYGVFYMALWAGLIGAIYAWQKPAPSCFDGVRNQNEAGVDCGGVCARACVPAATAPLQVVGDPSMILFGDAATTSTLRASLVAEIRNSNLDIGASNFGYTWSILDGSGVEIESFSASSFIYPGEIKYLTLLNAALPAGATPTSARIELGNPQWTREDRFPRPNLDILSDNTEVANNNLVVSGSLVNRDAVDFQTVYLTAIFYDTNSRIAGVSGTERNNVTSGESREFSLFHPLIQNVAPERTVVRATAFNPR
jgi:hypothetical protein